MLKKLLFVFLGFGVCFGMVGCGDKQTKMPETKQELPAAKPTNQSMQME